MTNELEKQFFDTFGIKEKEAIFCVYDGACPFDYPCDKCPYFLNNKGGYPQITDRILLELICILSQIDELEYYKNLEKLKWRTLERLIFLYEGSKDAFLQHIREIAQELKHKVKALFEEG